MSETTTETEPATEKPPESEPSLAAPLMAPHLLNLRARHQIALDRFQTQVLSAGGYEPWLQTQCPRAHVVVAGITVDAELDSVISSELEVFWRGLELRLQQCAICKPNEAACLDTTEVFSEGQLIELRVKGSKLEYEKKLCERYSDYRLSRRLIDSGAPVLLKDVKRSTLGEVSALTDEAFDHFLDSGVDASVPKRSHLLIEGRRASEHAVALYRSCMRNFPNASYRFVHVPTLMRDCREAMTAKSPSPLPEIADTDVVVLDNVGEAARKDWFQRELLWLYGRRVSRGLSTIITTPKPCKAEEAFVGATVLKV